MGFPFFLNLNDREAEEVSRLLGILSHVHLSYKFNIFSWVLKKSGLFSCRSFAFDSLF